MDSWVMYAAWKGMWTERTMQTESMDSWVMYVAWKGMWTEITVIGADIASRDPSLVKLASLLANS